MTTKQTLVTPGKQVPGKSTVVFDQAVRDDYDQKQARRNELSARLRDVNAEIKQINLNLGAWVAEGCDFTEHIDRLRKLKDEAEALQAGLTYLDNQVTFLERCNSWLR